MSFEKLHIFLFGMLIYNDYNDYRSVPGAARPAVWVEWYKEWYILDGF